MINEDDTDTVDISKIVEFILSAEKVYRDVALGGMFDGNTDAQTGEWVKSEFAEEAPDLWVETPEGPYSGMNMVRRRILPSSGFTSVDDMNAALSEYWNDDFKIESANLEDITTESINFTVIDGELYYFPAMACGIGTIFSGVIWELAEFEVLLQTDDLVIVSADVFVMAEGNLFRSAIVWRIVDNKIASRDFEWGEHVVWRDVPEAINWMVTSGRWTQEQVDENWENGWFDEQELWE